MKRLAALLLVLALLPAAAFAEKAASLPAAFRVEYKVMERLEGKSKDHFISKEHVTTAQPQVDTEINALVDDYDALREPEMKTCSNPKRNSRLDIHVIHSVTGDRVVSFLVLARESYKRKQVQSPFTTRTYDMSTGQRLYLADLFPDDSEAWGVIAEAVREGLTNYFPQLETDEEKLSALVSRDALENAEFMLGPVSLSLHYEASVLYEGKPSLMRVVIPYAKLRGMMTDFAERQTDNSNYKMVALTFDDGPSYGTSATLLNNLRHTGTQATFFLVGDRIDEYADIVLREHDENHSLQSHHYKHTDTTKSNNARIQKYTQQFYDTVTKLYGLAPIMLRPPYGLDEPFIKAKVNLPIVQWDVDTKDWTGKAKGAVMSVVRSETKDGSIILMHDIKEKTPDSAKAVAEWLHENGFLCVTVEELFAQYGQEMLPNHNYYSVKTD